MGMGPLANTPKLHFSTPGSKETEPLAQTGDRGISSDPDRNMDGFNRIVRSFIHAHGKNRNPKPHCKNPILIHGVMGPKLQNR